MALIGQDLPDVAVDAGDISWSTGPLRRFGSTAVKRDRVVPQAAEVGKHAEGVQDPKLALGIADLVVNLQSPPGVCGLIRLARLD
ncbi:MAG: hypothetical protein ABSG43_19530 [Solirubrobacteraceae bacterium]